MALKKGSSAFAKVMTEKYREVMEKPKSKMAAIRVDSLGRPLSKTKPAVRPRPRPARRPKTLYSPAEIEEIFRRFEVQRPEPQGELEHVNPFTLLVAVVLSAQATDAGVNRATRELFSLADTPDKMLALGEEQVGAHIRTIGLWRNKAKNVIALSKVLVEHHQGEVPGDRDILTTLPGVGRKTANVVLNMAFGQPTMAVDTHILRIGNRIGLAPGKTPDQVEDTLVRIIPDRYMRHAHHWLILHGRYVCKARKPDCPACVIADICKWPDKTASVPAPLVTLAEDAPPPGA
jgi:endonuclease-3